MNHLRVLSLTALILMLASRLPGQQRWDNQAVACNDGTIAFSVARAYRDLNFFSGYHWKAEGWYNVDPGECKEIGEPEYFHNGGLLRKDSVTLLAFAFYDSTGTWGAVRAREYPNDVYKPSDQQFCVKHDVFGYDRDSPGGDLPQECDAQTGYFLIPASFEYTGTVFPPDGLISRDEIHVKLAPGARAISLGNPTSTSGASQSSSGPGTSQSGGDASPSLCGKVSCWDLFFQGVREAEARRAAANANHNPPPPPPPPAPADDSGGGGSSTPPSDYGKTLTANLVFGGAVHLQGGQWRFENGTALPANLLDPQSGRPPLLPRQQYSPTQAPVSQYIKTIRDVLGSVQACQEYTDTTKTQLAMSVESSGFDLDDYGVVVSRTVATTPSSPQRIGYGQGAALANLDLQHAEFVDHGCMLLVIRCRNGSSCIRSQSAREGSDTGDLAVSSLSFEINTREQAAQILDALTAIAPFYPAGEAETHEIP